MFVTPSASSASNLTFGASEGIEGARFTIPVDPSTANGSLTNVGKS